MFEILTLLENPEFHAKPDPTTTHLRKHSGRSGWLPKSLLGSFEGAHFLRKISTC